MGVIRQDRNDSKSMVLQVSMFATGCAGIVAEFVLSTMATYLIGNAIFQWTIVMSVMLFAMGVGSRVSRFFKKNLLETFILLEFLLSIMCATSAVIAYGLAVFTSYTALIIYIQSFCIGVLIGLEIPLVTRLNGEYEELRLNISGVMEKDYFGSLLGGLIFAFVCLPYLGLTYTPILLGSINFLVASVLFFRFYGLLEKRGLVVASFAGCLVFLVVFAFYADPVIKYGEQSKYKDKVIYSRQTPYQKIVMTRWKEFYWLFINGQEQFSTFDEEKYHEPLVHPAMKLSMDRSHVLILGGGDGLALREVLKYDDVRRVTLVDLDPAMTGLAGTHPVLSRINGGSMLDPRVTVTNSDASLFLKESRDLYGVIIIDLPDPDSVDLMHVYSLGFYRMLKHHLPAGGVLVTQASSPYFSRDAFLCINKTITEAGFSTLPYHNQVPTMGEWGWVLGVRKEQMDSVRLKEAVLKLDFKSVTTRFINREAVASMANFGKGVFDSPGAGEIRYNSEINPVLFRYYARGSWGVY